MKNVLPRTVTDLIYQSERTMPGLVENLGRLGYSQTQVDDIRLHIGDLITARDAHAAGKSTVGTNRTSHALAMKTGRVLLMTARDALKPFLGREHSEAWVEAGFVNNFEVSRKAAELLRGLQGVKTYLTTHVDHENPKLNITAQHVGDVADELMNSIAKLDEAKSKLITLANDRDAKATLVRKDLHWLLSKLRVSFDKFDAMWERLGFSRPGFTATPEVPSAPSAELIGPDVVAVKWDAAPRAEHYRVWKKVVGVDEEFVAVALRTEVDVTIEGLPSGAEVEIAISAVNRGGESAKSEKVVLQTA